MKLLHLGSGTREANLFGGAHGGHHVASKGCKLLVGLVAGEGFEPSTFGL